MSVAYELKQKRAALIDRLQQLERERVDEPDFQASYSRGQVAVIGLVRQSRRCPR
jgi:hypothetical protein